MSTKSRSAQIQAAGWALARLIENDPTGLAGADPLAEAERQNQQGWTLETRAPLGNWVRHEGVTFAPDELAVVVAVAQRDADA